MLAAFLRRVASLVVRDSGSDSRISAAARPGSLFAYAYGKEMCVVGAIRLHCYVSPAAVSFGVPPRSFFFFSYTLLVGFSKKFFYRLDAVIVDGREGLEAIIVGEECCALRCVGEGRRIEGPSDWCDDDYYETVTLAAVFVLAEEAYICHTASGEVCSLSKKVIDKRHTGCCPLSIFWKCACCRVARFYIIQFFALLVKRAFYDEGF